MSLSISTPSGRVGRLLDYIHELWRRREFAVYLSLGNLKARNASTYLGLVWWVLNPLLLGGVYFLVFGYFRRREDPAAFLGYLMSGMFVFHFTSQSLTGGANAILSNSKLLVNLRFPRLVLPIAALIESAVGFLTSIVVFFLITIPLGVVTPGYRLIYLPVALAIHLVFNLGLACVSARLAVPFRDINNLIPYINRVWLYLSPIIWELSFLDGADEWALNAVKANPMYHLITFYRSILFNTTISMTNVVWSATSALVLGVVGITVFIKYEGHIVRHL